jgi:hypothetical protein
VPAEVGSGLLPDEVSDSDCSPEQRTGAEENEREIVDRWLTLLTEIAPGIAQPW